MNKTLTALFSFGVVSIIIYGIIPPKTVEELANPMAETIVSTEVIESGKWNRDMNDVDYYPCMDLGGHLIKHESHASDVAETCETGNPKTWYVTKWWSDTTYYEDKGKE